MSRRPCLLLILALLACACGAGDSKPTLTPVPSEVAQAADTPRPGTTGQTTHPTAAPTASLALPTGDLPPTGIAFVSTRDGNKEIYRIQADGSGLARLTDDPTIDADPAWSPDGRQIAFRARRDGTTDIFIMNNDGSNPTNLIGDAFESNFDEFAPAWSHDGQSLAIITDRFELNDGCSFHVVALMPTSGGKENIQRAPTVKGNQRSLAWSPDGRQLVFSSHCSSSQVIHLYLWDRFTGDTRLLVEGPSQNIYPAWSHDGRFIAFTSTRDGDSEVYLLELETGSLTNLTRHPARDLYPTWSPDDSQLAFATNRDGNFEIYVMDADGSNLRNLTQHPGFDSNPAWSPVPSTSTSVPSPTPEPQSAQTEPPPDPPSSANGNVERLVLGFETLMYGSGPSSPVKEGFLALPDGAPPPTHRFEGRLELIGEDTGGGFESIKGGSDLEPEARHLPEFDFEFVQSQGHLIPTRRGLIVTDHPNWNYIIEPGRVWQEAGDQGYARASFPFALVWKGSNATFNGTMTFLFDDEGISQAWYQITQETCTSLKANFWGLLEAAYHPGPVAGAAGVRAAYAQELAARFPTKPIEQLALDYPGVDLAAFGQGVSPEHMTWYGLVVDGVNYVGGCQTRYGPYPYCGVMRAPSYSTSKSIFASGALMRLAQKYDPQAPDLLIKDYVPEHEASPGDWSQVTFDHTLDMATGNYRSAHYMADEDGSQMALEFFEPGFYADKIDAAFNWPHSAPPGTQWVYRTSDTFILVRAMQNYLQTVDEDETDIWDFFVDEILVPLRVGPGAYTSLRTQDEDWRGQVYGGYGLWWVPDDVAKIATLFNNDGGAIDGEQILASDLLAAALQQNPDDRGVRVGQDRQYNNGFWADAFTPADGYDCSFWVPNMLGYSGNVVALMPNGTTYYYFSDNQEFTFAAAVHESNKIAPHCPEGEE